MAPRAGSVHTPPMSENTSSTPRFHADLLSPRWWPTWIGVGLIRLLAMLPLRWQVSLGETLGRNLGRLLGRRRHVIRTNLRLCFPDMPASERESLVDAHFTALGRGLFEAGMAWFASDARLAPVIEVEGREHLEAARASGQGLLLLTAHFSTLELGARVVVIDGKMPFHAMYRPYQNRVMDYCMHRFRGSQAGLPAIPRDDLRGLVKALRAGRAIWYAPDQALDLRNSVFAPFFGVPAATVVATSRLAKMGRARVLPYMPRKTERGWAVRFFPMLEDFPGEDEMADATRVNQAIEAGVRLALPEYFWIHKRFKRRPPGAPSVY